tara:strand:+ start:2921 stop:3562 length:642 start_codon:yes stop_codon:yes gene_type:complete
MKTNIAVIGGGGYAKVIISIVKQIEEYNLIGYTDLNDQGEILGTPYLGNDDKFIGESNQFGVNEIVLGVGQLQDSTIKQKIVSRFKENGFRFPKIISPTATVGEGVIIGEGTIIRDGAIISCSTKIGNFSIIGTSVNINHDSIIGDYCNISIGSTLGVNVDIFDKVFIGMGSTVINNIKITKKIFIGAGSLVTRDCLKEGVYYGRPAKLIRDL